MKNRSNHLKHKTRLFWLDVVSNSFLAVLFSFFFVFAQASDLVNVDLENCETVEGSTELQRPQLTADHDQPLHVPLNPVPLPPEPESKSERETNDHSDDDADKILATLSLRERFNLSSGKCLLFHLLNSRENRKGISLIILHHSWKSFLS
jgi:hypothetical protein